MGKKSKAEASGPVANGTAAQEGAELVIQPQKSTPKLDTSKWPLLLKVRPRRHRCPLLSSQRNRLRKSPRFWYALHAI